jgi:hydrogenase maturation protease
MAAKIHSATDVSPQEGDASSPTVVVLGVGNTLMQDDGIGVRAVQAFQEAYEVSPNVRVVDGGVAGLRWLTILDGAEHVIIVDAVIGAGPPGSIYRLDAGSLPKHRGLLMSAHEIGITEVLSVAELLGMRPCIRLIGVQPAVYQEVGLDLTPPLRVSLPLVTATIAEELSVLGIAVALKCREEEGDRHA